MMSKSVVITALVLLSLCLAQAALAADEPEESGDPETSDEQKDSLGRSPADPTRIDKLRNNHVDLTGQDLADASFPNSWPIFGSKARLAFGGYVKLDYLQDFDGVHNDRYELAAANVHVDDSGDIEEDGYMNLFARESRFNFDFRTSTEAGKPLRIFLEMDFWNLDRDALHNTPRLRHFYAVYDNWLVGRTWGLLTDVYSIPMTIDFQAGDAIAGSRRAQVRYENELGEKYKWGVALEMLEYPEIDSNGFDGKASQQLPLLSARVTRQSKLDGRMMLGASIYQLRWDGLQSGPDATALGWGFVFSGRHNFSEKFSFLWNASAGEGWATNVLGTLGLESSAILSPQGELETMFMWSASASFSYSISPIWVVNIHAGWDELDLSEYKPDESYEAGGTGHLNVIFSPVKSVNVGIEYQVAERVNNDGNSGVANRIQLMAKYFF